MGRSHLDRSSSHVINILLVLSRITYPGVWTLLQPVVDKRVNHQGKCLEALVIYFVIFYYQVLYVKYVSLLMTKYSIKPLDSQVSQKPSLIPRHPCVLNIVSPIGIGKSTLVILLATEDVFFKGNFHRIIIFSPTFHLDLKWTSVLSIKGVLKKCPHEMAEETIDLVAPQRKKRRFSGRIPADNVYTEYDEEVLKNLVESQRDYQ